MIVTRRYSERDEKQLRELIFPEEDRRLYTSHGNPSCGPFILINVWGLVLN